jgi:glutathione S-transferase
MIRGVPSPWSQAARGIFHAKGIEFAKVELAEGEPRALLTEWTGQDAFPAAMYDDERPRTSWEEILWLAERLAPRPSLIPSEPSERAKMFGLSREICGEMGLGWCQRLIALGAPMRSGATPMLSAMNQKFGSSEAETSRAQSRVLEILGLLAGQLAESASQGHRYFMGPDLTALDIYWATACNLLSPLPADRLELPEEVAAIFTASDPETHAALEPALLEHRDFVYETHLELPVEL